MNVQAPIIVLLLVSFTQHVQLLLSFVVLADHGPELVDFLVTLLQALVVVSKLILQAMLQIL